jgi:hypothetical protein
MRQGLSASRPRLTCTLMRLSGRAHAHERVTRDRATYTPGVVDVIDMGSSRPPWWARSRTAIAVLLIAGVALGAVLDHHDAGDQHNTSVMGSLTATEYAAAQDVMNDWASQKGIHLSAAFAVVKPTRDEVLTSCSLVVTLVGRNARVVPKPSSHSWLPGRIVVVARADPASGRTCEQTTVHGAPVEPPGAANLLPVE